MLVSEMPFNASIRKDYEKFVQLAYFNLIYNLCANIIGPLFYEAKINTLLRYYVITISISITV